MLENGSDPLPIPVRFRNVPETSRVLEPMHAVGDIHAEGMCDDGCNGPELRDRVNLMFQGSPPVPDRPSSL